MMLIIGLIMKAIVLLAVIFIFLVGLGIFFSLFFSGISAIAGPSISFLGIVFSVVFTRRQAEPREGTRYIIASCLSFLISFGIFVVYLCALLPIAFRYFGLT